MWPGVHSVQRGEYQKDDVVSIVEDGGETIAIGAMACSHTESRKEGVAVYLLHHMHDRLYETSLPELLPPQKRGTTEV